MITTAFVKIWDQTVGAVAWDNDEGLGYFEYDPAFVKFGLDLAPIKMPISQGKTIFSFPSLRANRNSPFDTFKGLPGLLADVLPDKYGNQLIAVWLAQNGRAQDSMNPVETLCFIGERGMGALEFEPNEFKEAKRATTIEMQSLVDMAKRALANREDFATSLAKGEARAMRQILTIGTSAGGARPKAVIAFNPKTNEVKSGQTKAPSGFEHWLIKLDGVSEIQLGHSQGYGRVEMAYYLMATACEIEMMPSQLLIENERAHFMTKRFDREGNGSKHHMQTFCAIQHFDFNEVRSFSYEQLFQTMRMLKLTYADAEQMFRRMAFNVIARNCDDHTKNFAFRMRREGPWELAPAYDICHAYRPDSVWVSHHALSVNGKRQKITKEDLLAVGKSMNIKKAKHIVSQINQIVHTWSGFAEEVNVNATLRDTIASTLIHY